MRTLTMTATMTACLAAAAAPAIAQDETSGEPTEPPPTSGMKLPKKRGLVQAFVAIDVSKDAEHVSLAPDIWYGITDKISGALAHSSRAISGFMGFPNGSLQLVKGDDDDTYSSVAVLGRYALKQDEQIYAAAEGGLIVNAFDPFELALKAGAVGRWSSGKLAAEAAPNIQVGLTSRSTGEGMTEVTTNGETLALPLTVMYQVHAKVNVAAQTGAVVPFQDAGDFWHLPFSLGAQAAVTTDIFVDVAFTLPILVGGEAYKEFDMGGVTIPAQNGFNTRIITVGGGYAF